MDLIGEKQYPYLKQGEDEDMPTYSTPDLEARKAIEISTHAESNLCWMCSTCDSECPIYLATGRLRPQKVVRMANLGFLDELLSLPEIWYCITCKRCNYMCPNLVKPASVISFLRKEAIRRNILSWKMVLRYRNIFSRLQRVRWHAAEQCLKGDMGPISHDLWREWLETPVDGLEGDVVLSANHSHSKAFKNAADSSSISSCFTCSECSNVCPIFFERSVFDPQWIFHMVNLGLEEILKSPSIWLCIACRRCTEACSQLVEGHLMIRRLQEFALEEGIVDDGFPFRWEKAQKAIYRLFVEEVDALLGINQD